MPAVRQVSVVGKRASVGIERLILCLMSLVCNEYETTLTLSSSARPVPVTTRLLANSLVFCPQCPATPVHHLSQHLQEPLPIVVAAGFVRSPLLSSFYTVLDGRQTKNTTSKDTSRLTP